MTEPQFTPNQRWRIFNVVHQALSEGWVSRNRGSRWDFSLPSREIFIERAAEYGSRMLGDSPRLREEYGRWYDLLFEELSVK